MPTSLDAATGVAVEKWYLRRGMTFMLQGTGLRESWTRRAVPPLLVMFVIAMLLVVPQLLVISLPIAALIGLVSLLAAWIGANLARRRKPFAMVERVDWFESAVFVLVPAIIVGVTPAEPILGDLLDLAPWQERLVFATIMLLWQLAVLAIVLTVVTTGLVPLSMFITRQIGSAASGSMGALTAALPVLLGVVFFFFFNPGVWLVIATLDSWAYAVLIALFTLLGGAFVGSRSQLDLGTLTTFDSSQDLRSALAGTPLAQTPVQVSTPVEAPLSHRQRVNLRLVAVLTRLVMAATVALAVFAAFVVLGFLTINGSIISTWTRLPPTEILHVTTGGTRHVLAWQQLKVAGFLGCFAGFNFSLVSASDARLRESVKDTATDVVRQASAIRIALMATDTDRGRRAG